MTHAPERSDSTGLAINIAVTVGIAAIGNGLIALLGWPGDSPNLQKPGFQPPGIVIGAVWMGLFAAMGAARWIAARDGTAGGRRDAHLLTALILLCFAYPYYTRGFSDVVIGLAGSLVTMLLAAALAWRIHRRARLAALLIAPTALWCAFASVILVRTLQINP